MPAGEQRWIVLFITTSSAMLAGELLAAISYKMAIEIKRFIVGESIPPLIIPCPSHPHRL
ncbi:MAG: hypothetical protein ABIJ04_07925 [Bacteroidota bacterium]